MRSDKAINEIVGAISPFTKEEIGKNLLPSDSTPPNPPLSKGGINPQIVFEIGPGEGVLTQKLLEKGFTVIVIEIDKRSIEILEQKFESEIKNKKLFIIERDCLEVDFKEELKSLRTFVSTPFIKGETVDTDYTLVGNIPYYITGAIFRHTFEQKLLPTEAIFLIQKEVAERIVARDKKQSLLSVSIKIFSDEVKIVDIVKAGSFVPPPKVDSAIIKIGNIKNVFDASIQKQNIFFQILRAAFSHKRKFLLTNLKTDLDKNIFEKYFTIVEKIIKAEYSEKARAEDVSIETWKKIISNI